MTNQQKITLILLSILIGVCMGGAWKGGYDAWVIGMLAFMIYFSWNLLMKVVK